MRHPRLNYIATGVSGIMALLAAVQHNLFYLVLFVGLTIGNYYLDEYLDKKRHE